MTFCLGIKVSEGLVGIADTRVISGNENISARKISVYEFGEGCSLFLMTSGLRSVRDKAVTYFDEVLDHQEEPFDRLFKAANGFASQIRKVAAEDKVALEASGLNFNMYCLMGGRLSADDEPKLYLIYPQGNWVEIGQETPYHIIGSPGYGKPVLDRTLKYSDSMQFALKVGCLAFDSTRISAANVDFPVEVILYGRDSFRIVRQRFDKADLADASGWWQERLRQSVQDLRCDWAEPLLSRVGPPR